MLGPWGGMTKLYWAIVDPLDEAPQSEGDSAPAIEHLLRILTTWVSDLTCLWSTPAGLASLGHHKGAWVAREHILTQTASLAV